MQKRILFVIVLVMFLASVLGFSVRPASCTTTVLSQNFDNEPTGSIPQGWTVENPNICSLTVDDSIYYGASGKSAHYEDNVSSPTGYAFVGTSFEAQSGAFVLSFAVMAENPDYFHVYVDDGDWHHAANVYFRPDLTLAYYDDFGYHYFGSFSPNTWYKVKMVVDVRSNTYDIYMNDALMVKGALFRGFGKATQLHRFIFNLNSMETSSGYIDDISIVAIPHTTPIATQITFAGDVDYLFDEDINVTLVALVKDIIAQQPVSNASVTLEIYCPNGSLLAAEPMVESVAGSGVYVWESNGTIKEMKLAKGVYWAKAMASIKDDLPSSTVTLFHIDPPSGAPTSPATAEVYYLATAIAISGAIVGTILLRRRTRELKFNSFKVA